MQQVSGREPSFGHPQGRGLLDSYDPERCEVVVRTRAVASGIYRDWVATKEKLTGYWELIAQGGEAAAEGRRKLGTALLETFRRECNAVPAALGGRYEFAHHRSRWFRSRTG
jgi:hypothetical protein